MSIRRQIAWQARLGSTRIREGGKKAAGTCWGDFTTPRLVPIKVTFFFIMGATQCVGPFSTLFARSLGLSLKETAIVFSIAPLIPLLAPTLAGVIADKIGNFKVFLMIAVVLSGAQVLLMMAIPPARVTSVAANNISFEITCWRGHYILRLTSSRDDCEFIEKDRVTIPSLRTERCGYLCPVPVIQYPANMHERLAGLPFKIKHGPDTEFECSSDAEDHDALQKCFITEYNSTIVNINDPTTFVLDKVTLEIGKLRTKQNALNLAGQYLMAPMEQHAFDCSYGFFSNDFNLSKVVIAASEGESKSDDDFTTSSSTSDGGDAGDFNEEEEHIYSECRFHCDVTVPHDAICSQQPTNKDVDVYLTLWLFVCLKIVSSFTIGLTYTLFEVATIAVLKHYGNDYGLQRLYGSIGGMVFAPLAGLLVDIVGDGTHYTDYYVTFALYFLIKLICAGIIKFIDLRFKTPSRNLWQNVCRLLITLEVFLLVVSVLVSGICYGFIEHFQPWLLRDLGADNWFIGLTTTVASLAALPFLAISGGVCARFGHIQSICFGLLCYAVRCMGYSLLTNPFWCLPLEVAEGATTGLLIAATILYAAKLAPKNSQATLQGVLATVHYGLGKSLGSFSGGLLMDKLGAPAAFQIFSGVSVAVAFLYYIVYKLHLLPREQQLEALRREVCNMPIRGVSTKEHRRNSLRYDRSFFVTGRGGTALTQGDPSSRPQSIVEGDAEPSEDTNPSRNALYPSWSDEEDDQPQYQGGYYPPLDAQASASTPFKSGMEATPPDYNLSDVDRGDNDDLQQTEVSYLSETQQRE